MQQVSVSLFLHRLQEFDITPLQYTILRIINSNSGINQTSIAIFAVLDMSTVKDIVHRLEAKGLLRRDIGNADRRMRCISLTARGMDVLSKAESEVKNTQKILLAPLEIDEQETLMRLLGRLLAVHEESQGVDKSAGEKVHTPWRRHF